MNMSLIKKYSTWIILGIYLVLGIWGSLNHEPWRDEVEPFLIARESHNPVELFVNARYEGHPLMWYGILFILTRFTSSVIVLGLVHVLIGGVIAYLFLKYSPFSWFNKILFLCGYYPLYEYFLISRNYSLIILFLFLFCILYVKKSSLLKKTFVLFLLLQTHVLGALLAVVLFTFLITEKLRGNKKELQNKEKAVSWSVCSMILGIIIFLFTTWPLANNTTVAQTVLSNITFIAFWEAFVPVRLLLNPMHVIALPLSKLQFGVEVVLSFGLFFFIGYLLKGSKKILFLYSGLIFAVIACFHVLEYFWITRHIGVLFFIFIICSWIYLAEFKDKNSKNSNWLRLLLTTLLLIQAIVGVYYFTYDLTRPFSHGQNVAEFIVKNNLQKLTISGYPDYTTQPILAYVPVRAYYHETRAFGTYVYWDTHRRIVPEQQFVVDTKSLLEKYKKDVLLIVTPYSKIEKNLALLKQNSMSVKKIAEFDSSMVMDENYTLYLIHLDKK